MDNTIDLVLHLPLFMRTNNNKSASTNLLSLQSHSWYHPTLKKNHESTSLNQTATRKRDAETGDRKWRVMEFTQTEGLDERRRNKKCPVFAPKTLSTQVLVQERVSQFRDVFGVPQGNTTGWITCTRVLMCPTVMGCLGFKMKLWVGLAVGVLSVLRWSQIKYLLSESTLAQRKGSDPAATKWLSLPLE